MNDRLFISLNSFIKFIESISEIDLIQHLNLTNQTFQGKAM